MPARAPAYFGAFQTIAMSHSASGVLTVQRISRRMVEGTQLGMAATAARTH